MKKELSIKRLKCDEEITCDEAISNLANITTLNVANLHTNVIIKNYECIKVKDNILFGPSYSLIYLIDNENYQDDDNIITMKIKDGIDGQLITILNKTNYEIELTNNSKFSHDIDFKNKCIMHFTTKYGWSIIDKK